MEALEFQKSLSDQQRKTRYFTVVIFLKTQRKPQTRNLGTGAGTTLPKRFFFNHFPQRCMVCSAPHDYREYTSLRDPKCAKCGGAHAGSYSGFPRRRAVIALRKHEILHWRVPQRRVLPPNPAAVRPTSVSIPLLSKA